MVRSTGSGVMSVSVCCKYEKQNPLKPTAVIEINMANMSQKIPLTVTYSQYHGMTMTFFSHTKQCYNVTMYNVVVFFVVAKNRKAKMVKCHDVRSRQPSVVIKRVSNVFFQSRLKCSCALHKNY